MSDNTSNHAFITNIRLSGYKSIRNMNVRLNSGLNIIIGPNGSGKTNFLTFLNEILTNKTEEIDNPFTFELSFSTPIGNIAWKQVFDGKYEAMGRGKQITNEILIEEKPLEEIKYSRFLLLANLPRESEIAFLIFPTIIPFSIPRKLAMLDRQGSISHNFESGGGNKFLLEYLFEADDIVEKMENTEYVEEFLENQILNDLLVLKKDLILNLQKYSPIKNLRLSKGINISVEEYILNINYINLEFLVNDFWLTWDQLSDGTKRLFWIIANVGSVAKLALIEEPENGVHPDQLYLLMDFLKEQAQKKQIIITTHSPDVLNIVEKEELDSILITRFEGKSGTQMHHLSDKKRLKAQSYMEKIGYLSRFWVNSNMEEYDGGKS